MMLALSIVFGVAAFACLVVVFLNFILDLSGLGRAPEITRYTIACVVFLVLSILTSLAWAAAPAPVGCTTDSECEGVSQ